MELEKDLIKKIPYYECRNSVRPGISGWAQVNYPYGASISDTVNKLSFDIYYISNFSLLLELIRIFERVNKCVIPIEFTKRRKGDVPFSVANISLALKVLDWSPNRSIEEACLDGWRWQLNKQ